MEWIGAIFKGIGDTFTAGANVNLGQMNERNVKRQIALEEDTLRADQELSQVELLRTIKQEQTKKILIISISLIALLFIIVYFNRS